MDFTVWGVALDVEDRLLRFAMHGVDGFEG
jgi:hypothetical protein